MLSGRLKEMYIRGGYNVYPTEVEAVLTEHPGVARAAVIGGPDPVLGEIGIAFVVPEAAPAAGRTGGTSRDTGDDTGDENHESGNIFDPAALRSWCTDRIADYKAPDRVVVVGDLPVTAVGKLDKNALARRWAELTADESAGR